MSDETNFTHADKYRDIDCCEMSLLLIQRAEYRGDFGRMGARRCLFCDGNQECYDYPFVRVSARIYNEDYVKHFIEENI